jgi:hypothetical protein
MGYTTGGSPEAGNGYSSHVSAAAGAGDTFEKPGPLRGRNFRLLEVEKVFEEAFHDLLRDLFPQSVDPLFSVGCQGFLIRPLEQFL